MSNICLEEMPETNGKDLSNKQWFVHLSCTIFASLCFHVQILRHFQKRITTSCNVSAYFSR